MCLSASASALLLPLIPTGPEYGVVDRTLADVIYFDTELKFSAERLRQILLARLDGSGSNAGHHLGGASASHGSMVSELLSRVIVHRVSSLSSSIIASGGGGSSNIGSGLRDLQLLMQKLRDLSTEVPATGAKLVRSLLLLRRYACFIM